MPQELFEILALALSCGQGSFPAIGKPERALNEILPNGFLLRTLRLRVAEDCRLAQVRLHSGTVLPERKSQDANALSREETQIPRRDALDRNDLSGLLWSCANKQTARPERHGIVSSWLFVYVSQICLFTLSEDPG
jgi:hypothetical protein